MIRFEGPIYVGATIAKGTQGEHGTNTNTERYSRKVMWVVRPLPWNRNTFRMGTEKNRGEVGQFRISGDGGLTLESIGRIMKV